jgi:DNA-binding transcriptional ArsR family regulator
MPTQVELVETFAALGDPVRQMIVERLADGDATVNELAAMFPISLQAVSRHIKVLEAASLIRTADWLEAHRLRLESRYERLDAVLEELKESE